MPRRPSGKPQWEALAVKLPPQMIEEVRRYADLHCMSMSEVIREGLDMRLHGRQQMSEYNGNTVLPAATVAMLARLTTTLTTATEQLRQVCAGARVAEGEEEAQSAAKLQSYNSNTVSPIEEYNGNTLYTVPDTAPKQEPSGESQPSEACPPFDTAKYVLGRLCPQRHEWGTTGQSRLTMKDRVCPECRNALKRRKRAEKHEVAQA
jgi:hypothetical protein